MIFFGFMNQRVAGVIQSKMLCQHRCTFRFSAWTVSRKSLNSTQQSSLQMLKNKSTGLQIFNLKFKFNQIRYASSSSGPDRNRLRYLMLATYSSCAIGLVFLTAIAFRFYGQFQKRARGIIDLEVPGYGRHKEVFSQYRGYTLLTSMVNTVSNEIPWFKTRENDVWVISYPKAGTTWLQEIVYLICNDCDLEKAKGVKIDDRFPFLEFPFPGVKAVAELPSPRFIKTHLPFSLLPSDHSKVKPKIIYIARNPKDTAVSLWSFTKLLTNITFHGSMEDFAQLFVDGKAMYGPWWKHVQEGWEHRTDNNVLFITYEGLQEDFRGTVREVARFLNKSVSEAQLQALERHCSFQSMRANNAVNYSWMAQQGVWNQGSFMRKGEVGDWKNHLTAEMSSKFDNITSKLEPSGLQFSES